MSNIPHDFMNKLKSMREDGLDKRAIHKKITDELRAYYKGPEGPHKEKITPSRDIDDDEAFFVVRSLDNWFAQGTASPQSLRLLGTYFRILASRNHIDKFDEALLTGPYNVYFSNSYDSGEGNILRAPLYMEKQNNSPASDTVYTVTFRDVRAIYEGSARIENGLMSFDLRSGEKFICFAVLLPKAGSCLDHNSFVLDAKANVDEETGQYFRNLIIVKDTVSYDEKKSRYLERPIVPCMFSVASNPEHSPTDAVNTALIDGLTDDQRNQIMIYLSRRESRNFLLSQFNGNSFTGLAESNKRYDRNEGVERYYKVKRLLSLQDKGYKYYAFNRSKPDSSQVSIFFYQFSFSDPERMCRVTRMRIEEPQVEEFTGEILLDNDRLYFILTDYDRDNVRRRKIVISNYEPRNSSQYFILKAITASVILKTNEPMGLRELIAYLPESELRLTEDEMKVGCISYNRFCELSDSMITREDRGYLANRSLCIISYPQRNGSIHMRQGMSNEYRGTYHVYILNGYDAEQKTLLKLILKIDGLSQVVITVKYSDSAEEYIYRGDCQYYGLNISIQAFLESGFTNKQRMATMIFDQLPSESENIYTGITIDTDRNQNAVSYSFLAISDQLFMRNHTSIPAEPEIVDKETFKKQIIKDLLKSSSVKVTAERVIQAIESDDFFWKGGNIENMRK